MVTVRTFGTEETDLPLSTLFILERSLVKILFTLIALALLIMSSTSTQAGTASWDINVPGAVLPESPTQSGFNSYPATGTNGSIADAVGTTGYSFDLTGVEQQDDTRDRGTNPVGVLNTPFNGAVIVMQGADNNDNEVPEGAFAALYQDFVFDRGSDGMTGTFSGLEANSVFDVTVWSYDSGAVNDMTTDAVIQDFSVGGSVVANLTYEGDLDIVVGTGVDPNTDSDTDYTAIFQVTSDGSGAASFSTVSTGPQFARFNAVSIASVPEPCSVALLCLAGLCGVCGRRR